MRRLRTVVAATAAATLLFSAVPAAAHGGKHDPRPPVTTDIATGLVTPLSLAVGPRGTTYVTQNFAGLLTSVDRDGTPTVLYASPDGAEVGGVSYAHRTITFTETVFADAGSTATVSTLRTNRSGEPVGSPRVLADIRAYEERRNPDGKITYGLRRTDPACVAQVPDVPVPALYTGVVDAHPYATTTSRGTTYLADAGMNAILSISDRGRVRTVAVLPAQPAVVTAEAAAELGWPDCVVGEKYWFESVPTDVEVGPRGTLYVSTLPGGPEDESLGARGAVYTVDPRNGKVRQIASGFVGATNLAVTSKGTVYVAEMFGGRVSEVKRGGPRTVVEVPLPGGLEWDGKRLLATTNVLPGEGQPPDGHLVRIDLKHRGHGR
ncbi:ScyD/ScyE family protein [Oerskovia flava]|uniref:ScyD/ScyE family protein n=1 Tax=Oerskovia flava TaxID=2986422 RepID=UPI00223F7E69|nr:ScyD/ScyE family protein [Oerskovia sp. JB1-3-2]